MPNANEIFRACANKGLVNMVLYGCVDFLFLCPELCELINFFISFSVDQIFREANVSPGGQVQYQDFVKIACAPVPDYY